MQPYSGEFKEAVLECVLSGKNSFISEEFA